jgi:LytS/YehU family sensor histidine kinase
MTPTYGIFVYCLRYGVLAALIAGAFVYFRSERESASTAHACNMDAERLDEQASQARLQVLEAQIEPHFLFNALATVKRLFHTDPATGERMLDNMMRYLSIALPHIRAGDSTVRREVKLAEAYLEIQKIRMGNRLAFRVELPDALGDATLPTLMLPTLVENAIKHGIGPLPQGGEIVIRARAESGMLRVEVADDGRGFQVSSGGGTGLANLRARLKARFGTNGGLTLTPAQPTGLTVAITLPLAFGTPSP